MDMYETNRGNVLTLETVLSVSIYSHTFRIHIYKCLFYSVCGKNEEFQTCGTACPETCKNYANCHRPCIEKCVKGCFCKPGYVRADDNTCVLKSQCTAGSNKNISLSAPLFSKNLFFECVKDS